MQDRELRVSHGTQGQQRVQEHFRNDQVWEQMLRLYRRAAAMHPPGRALPRALKRFLDLGGAAMGIVLLSPVLLAAGLAVLVTMGRPVFFRQWRAGRYGRPFHLVKFRSMRAANSTQSFYAEGNRITGLGGFLRRTSIDELPSLLNVLRGDMSLVGPRPLLPEYTAAYTDAHVRRLAVRPGLTGLAQVSGRQLMRFSERFALDLDYIERWTLLRDLRILLATVPAVLRSEGVVNGQQMEEIDDLGLIRTLQRDR